MKIINGKLLGKAKNDWDIFKEYQNRHNLNLDISLKELEQRIDKAETELKGEALRKAILRRVEAHIQKLEERCNYLQQEQQNLRKIEKRYEYIETTKLSQIEQNLLKIKQLIPHKLLWLTFGTSLVLGTISLYNLLIIYPANNQFPGTRYNPSGYNLIELEK